MKTNKIKINKSIVKSKAKVYLMLYVAYGIYTLALVMAKLASVYSVLSIEALFLYGSAFGLLAIFALVWQQILKRLPLIVAHANKAVTIVYGLLWGHFLFDETISFNMVAGTIIIFIGIILVMKREN